MLHFQSRLPSSPFRLLLSQNKWVHGKVQRIHFPGCPKSLLPSARFFQYGLPQGRITLACVQQLPASVLASFFWSAQSCHVLANMLICIFVSKLTLYPFLFYPVYNFTWVRIRRSHIPSMRVCNPALLWEDRRWRWENPQKTQASHPAVCNRETTEWACL